MERTQHTKVVLAAKTWVKFKTMTAMAYSLNSTAHPSLMVVYYIPICNKTCL